MAIQYAKAAATPTASKQKRKNARPGRPASGKLRLTLLVDPDVLAAFRATGPGWQARINETLRRHKP